MEGDVYRGNNGKIAVVTDESRIKWDVGGAIFARCLSLPRFNISTRQKMIFKTPLG